ncbi:MAG: hypothetical protein P8N11_06235 [Gammaproteobacteria bacterium]|nr:hypothetical protein [Gammaproteobacteria bacterium]
MKKVEVSLDTTAGYAERIRKFGGRSNRTESITKAISSQRIPNNNIGNPRSSKGACIVKGYSIAL